MDVGRAGPLGRIGPAVGCAACSAAVPALEEGAAVAAEADVVSDCRPRFASSIPPKTPAAARRGSERQPVRSSAQHESWNEVRDGRGAVPVPPRLLGRCRTWVVLWSLELKPLLALPMTLPTPSSEEVPRRGSRSTSRRCCSPRLMPWAGTRFPRSSDDSCLMRPWRWWGTRVRRWGDRSRPSGGSVHAAPRG